ncbi:MAG TPA: hypothetical protein DCF68_08525 [Cyanothece sp. UBA12306]|nr:hypothetical protein [Cyanothece sp. UBA12306]
MTRKNFQHHNYLAYLQSKIRLLLIFLLSLGLIFWGGQVKFNQEIGWKLQSVNSQTLRPENAAEMVYDQLTYLPKENQYRRQDTDQIDPKHTLISRLIRYHQDVKRRSPQVRLDWKVTLADYLGVNETIKDNRYPGNSTLQTNPMETDVAAIQQLNRRQRQELVDLLVSLYTPQPKKKPLQETLTESAPEPSTPRPPIGPGLSQPGDAQLLAP